MRYAVLVVVLIGAAMLGGCTEGVLDPKGPIAAAERLIMLNSTGIMLAIVIPVRMVGQLMPPTLQGIGKKFWLGGPHLEHCRLVNAQ